MIQAVTIIKFQTFAEKFCWFGNSLFRKVIYHPRVFQKSCRTYKLIESCSKYPDYLESNLTAVSEYQSSEEPNHIETIVELPYLDGPLDGKYKN